MALLSELAQDLSYGVLALRNRRNRQRPETALQENEERLRLALNAAQIGLWDWNILTDQIIWSAEHERLFGLADGTFDGSYRTFAACVHPEDRASVLQVVNHARAEKTDYCHQYRIVWPDDSIHWIEGRGKLYCTAGEVVRILGTVVDISIRKQAEMALQAEKRNLELRVAERTVEMLQVNRQLQKELNQRQKMQADLQLSQAQFAGILDIAADAIISIDRQQQITLFNQGAERIFGYAAAEVLGQPLDILLPARFAQLHQQQVTDFKRSPVQARRMGERREIFGRRKDGSEFPAEASISKLATGQEMLFTVFLQDITERRQIERMKDEFVSVVSHELRTPLTSIHGSLGLLASGLLKPDSEQGRRMLQIAVDSTDRLVRLINDILDIERIESGRVQMEKQLCQMADLITEAANIVQPLADQAQVTLSVRSSSLQVQADPDRIIQTLTNLLSNAIKFSSSGSTIWLTAQQQADRLLVTVKDQGCGIPEGKLDSIFERFQQVDSSNSRNHEGTGLGLAICRSIVQQHDGKIWVESSLGEGSSFYFTLPVEPSPSWQQAARTSADACVDWTSQPLDESLLLQSLGQGLAKSPGSIQVLIVEDDQNLAEVLVTLFEQHRVTVFHAKTGQEAIRLSQHITPDLLVLDLILPEGDGFTVVKWLQQEQQLQEIPLIVYSGKDLDISERNRLRLGPTEFLSKGQVTIQEFEQRVMALLQQVTATQATEQQKTAVNYRELP
jgi:PAS domain S-box-containing protein